MSDESKKGRWAPVGIDLRKAPWVSAPMRVWLFLWERRDFKTMMAEESSSSIVAATGLSKSGLRKALIQLDTVGYVKTVVGGGHCSNRYRLRGFNVTPSLECTPSLQEPPHSSDPQGYTPGTPRGTLQ